MKLYDWGTLKVEKTEENKNAKSVRFSMNNQFGSKLDFHSTKIDESDTHLLFSENAKESRLDDLSKVDRGSHDMPYNIKFK